MTELGVGFSQLAPIILYASPHLRYDYIIGTTRTPSSSKGSTKIADFIIEMIEEKKLQIILETILTIY